MPEPRQRRIWVSIGCGFPVSHKIPDTPWVFWPTPPASLNSYETQAALEGAAEGAFCRLRSDSFAAADQAEADER
ncbi:MAG TPA: hypothetical protein VL985_02350 [Stellaceae bacterium]|nr:hypothetical protein [Stellaceae bacterium]